MVVHLFLLCVQLLLITGFSGSVSGLQGQQQHQNLQYLQAELELLSKVQQNIGSFLRSRRVSIGSPFRTLSKGATPSKDALSRIAVSTAENLIECRVALGKAPIGAKCVAPCSCTGSQKWVQFAELNRLRRKDPDQWTVCRTCRQRFEYELFDQYGTLPANLLGNALEHRGVVRGALLVGLAGLLCWLSVHLWMARLLTSRTIWMKYPQWSRLLHLPLPLKFWVAKVAVQYLWESYLHFEKETLVAGLADLETRFLEDRLPGGEGQAGLVAGEAGEATGSVGTGSGPTGGR